MKITLVAKETWTTNDRVTGEEISGISFIGYLPNGKPIKFTSRHRDHAINLGQVGFDKDLAEDIDLKTKMFGDKISYQELEPSGE